METCSFHYQFARPALSGFHIAVPTAKLLFLDPCSLPLHSHLSHGYP